jgi:hypothetical protein
MNAFFQSTTVSKRALPDGTPPPRYGFFSITVLLDKAVCIDIRANAEFKNMVIAFESVELLDCIAEISSPCAASGTGAFTFGFVPAGTTSATDILKHAHHAIRHVGKNDAALFVLPLPSAHNFGRELKATILGNAAPCFAVDPANITTAYATVRFRAAFHGSALG